MGHAPRLMLLGFFVNSFDVSLVLAYRVSSISAKLAIEREYATIFMSLLQRGK